MKQKKWRNWPLAYKSGSDRANIKAAHGLYEAVLIEFFRLYLVGGIPTPLKNMKVSWDDSSQYIWKNKSHVPNHQPDIVC